MSGAKNDLRCLIYRSYIEEDTLSHGDVKRCGFSMSGTWCINWKSDSSEVTDCFRTVLRRYGYGSGDEVDLYDFSEI